MELPLRVTAPAKVNLCLYVGPRREDGLHSICSLFQSVSVMDDLVLERAEGKGDEVLCPGIEGPNLIDAALAAYREDGPREVPPLRVTVEKRIPVAAGLGGGSADAAALLRALAALDPEPPDEAELRQVAMSVGSDVPSQLEPGLDLVTGAGEVLEPLTPFASYALVLVPGERALSTAGVYAEVDRRRSEPLDEGSEEKGPAAFAIPGDDALPEHLGPQLQAAEARLRAALRSSISSLPELASNHLGLLRNDLQPAAIVLDGEIEPALHDLRDAGAEVALVSGSGPTALGLFADSAAAERAQAGLARRWPRAAVAVPVTADESLPRPA